MTKEFLDWVIQKLGTDAVLLPVPRGQKGCKLKGWTDLTSQCMADPKHNAKLLSHGNLGVALGKQSAGLCTIDIDDDNGVAEFFDRNPELEGTLRTKGARGCNLWIRIVGDYSPSSAIKRLSGHSWGEWRADGNQTIFAGLHPKGVHYQLCDPDAAVIELRYDDIIWPDSVIAPRNARRGEEGGSSSILPPANYRLPSTPTTLPSTSVPSTPLRSTANSHLGGSDANARLHQLYEQHIAENVIALPDQRNDALVELVPKLFFTVSARTVVDLLMMFYDRHLAIWKDPRERHEYEMRKLLESCELSFINELSQKERSMYGALPRDYWKETFRICRSLASYSGPNAPPPPVFFLSNDELAKRIDQSSQTCGNILRKFCQYRLLDVVAPGIKRSKGVAGKATHYRWSLE